MSVGGVEALIFRRGPHLLAVELRWISTLLTLEEAVGMARLDPGPYLFRAAEAEGLGERWESRVGLLEAGGAPKVVVLGEVVATVRVEAGDVLRLPEWLARGSSEILLGGCLLWEENIVWLLDLATLRKAEWK